MLRRSDLPLPYELPATDDDPALFDPSAEWFVRMLKPPRGDADGDDELGLRGLIERPEALSKAWRRTAGRRARGARRKNRPRRWSHAA